MAGSENIFRRSIRCLFLIACLLCASPGPAQNQKHVLDFVKKIGVGWSTDRWMSFVSFSPDGTMVASDGPASPDDHSDNLTFWSFPDGRLIKRLPARAAAISSNWKYYATDRGVADLETGKVLITASRDVGAGYAFSPDSRYVAESGTSRDHAIRILDLPTGRQVSAFGSQHVFGMALSPDGRTVAAGYWDIVTLWNLVTGQRMGVLRGFKRYVIGLSFSPDGKLLAGGTDAGGLQVWDVGSLTRIVSLNIEAGSVSDPAFSPAGQLVAVGMYGTGAVWLVDVSSGKLIDHQKVSDLGCGSVAFSPDGRFLITPSTGGLITWPHDQGGTIRVFRIDNR